MADEAVITVVTTLTDGQVVRWHCSVDDATHHRPVLSASRRGVTVHATYLHEVPDGWQEAASDAHAALRADRRTDLTHLATHQHCGALNGPLVPVEEGGN